MPSFLKKTITERPEVGLVDWAMASQDLETTTALLKVVLRSTSIIFLTVSENSPEKQEMLRLGACAFLSKWSSARKLRTAVLKATDGPPPMKDGAVARATALPAPSNTDTEQRVTRLTRRERQLLPLVCGRRVDGVAPSHLHLHQARGRGSSWTRYLCILSWPDSSTPSRRICGSFTPRNPGTLSGRRVIKCPRVAAAT